MSKAVLESTRAFQKGVYDNKVNHNFNVTDINQEFLFLYGEVAEAYEAARRTPNTLGSELADIALYLLGIAEIKGIDLGEEINKKMEINEGRKYTIINGVEFKQSSDENGG